MSRRVTAGAERIRVWSGETATGDPAWEDAYVRFETAEQEITKFRRRLRDLGAARWPKEARIVELFCGRGNGLKALERLGFTSLEGVDMSRALLDRYEGSALLYQGDCRRLRFEDASKDVVLVQGGLHHLPALPEDLHRTLAEVHRVLKPRGTFAFVEPWLTPFLRIVHAACERRSVCALWPRLAALRDMIAGERDTYERWLACPAGILDATERYFETVKMSLAWGKIMYVGRKRDAVPPSASVVRCAHD